MRVLVALLITLAMLSPSYASSANLDALLAEADDLRSADFSGFEAILEEIEQHSNELTYEQNQIYQFLKGYQYTFRGDVDQGITLYSKIETSDAPIALRLKALSSLVNNYAVKRDFYLGAKAINRLYALREKVSDQNAINTSFLTVGIFYNQAHQFKLGLNVANQLLQRAPTPRQECFARHIKIESEFEIARILGDYNYVRKSIDFCQDINEKLVANMILMSMAESMSLEGRLQESQALLLDKLSDSINSQYPPLIGEHYARIAKNYLDLGNIEKAQEYAAIAYQTIKNVGNTKPLVTSLEVLSEVAEQKKNFADTVYYLKMFHQAEKAYLDEVKARGLSFQQAQYEKSEQDHTIKLLDKQNTLLRIQNALSQQQSQNNRLALALSSVLLILLFLWLYRSRRIQLKLRKLAQTDELTGINNRHFFNEIANQLVNQAQNHKQDICFVLFDLDYFKRINDQFGHQIGDWALKQSVLEAQKVCRSNDVIGRMGGEEFAILLPGCNIEEGMRVAEICRSAIERIDSSPTGHQFTITASFGVADAKDCGYSLDKLFAGSDNALYSSKERGRNQVYCYDQKVAV